MWVEANSKYKRYQYHSARVLHLNWFKSLGTFRKASRSTILRICELTIDPFSLKTGHVVRRDTGTLVNTTTLITIPALRILKCNDSSRFFLFLRIWNRKLKLKWKIEIFYAFSTLRIFHTPDFPHPSFSTPRTPRFPPNLEGWFNSRSFIDVMYGKSTCTDKVKLSSFGGESSIRKTGSMGNNSLHAYSETF